MWERVLVLKIDCNEIVNIDRDVRRQIMGNDKCFKIPTGKAIVLIVFFICVVLNKIKNNHKR